MHLANREVTPEKSTSEKWAWTEKVVVGACGQCFVFDYNTDILDPVVAFINETIQRWCIFTNVPVTHTQTEPRWDQ